MTEPFLTKSDLAYSQLRRLILSGDLPPGTAINQEALAQSLGISTTPLREALRRLKSEGLVHLDAHRDARVTTLDVEEARDLLEIRRSLDPLAAGLAAQRRTHEDIALLRRTVADVRPLPDDPAVSELVAHRVFHTALYRASHNTLLIHTLDALWDKADRYRRLGLKRHRDQDALDQKTREHLALVELIAAGDSDGAEAVMRDHIDTSLGVEALRLLAQPASPVEIVSS